MPRGGRRNGSGRKSTWKSGCKFQSTKLIRVPSVLADQLLDLAHWLDSDGEVEKVAKVSQGELSFSIKLDASLEIETNSKGYTETALAEEIGINRSTLKNRKSRYLQGLILESDFNEYLCKHDSKSRNWYYCKKTKKYYF